MKDDVFTSFINIYSHPENKNIKYIQNSFYHGVNIVIKYWKPEWEVHNYSIERTLGDLLGDIQIRFPGIDFSITKRKAWIQQIINSKILDF